MRPCKKTRRVLFAAFVLALALSGCGRKRRTPLPAPAPGVKAPSVKAPRAEAGVTAEKADDVPRAETALAPPQGCEAGPRVPWFQCIYTSPSGERLRYYLALPAFGNGEDLPVVTILHGSSNSGAGDGKALDGASRFATDLWIREDVQRRYPSIVVVPQAEPPAGETWVRAWRAPHAGDSRPKEALVLVMELLGALEARYPVDRRRLYLTGQSMGGFGAWLAYTRYPGIFAAVAPVCGGGDPAAVVPNASAVWAFHGERDTAVPVQRSREMVAAIRAAGSEARYTEYPGLGHNIFSQVYAEDGLVEWIFAQRLPAGPVNP